MAKKRLKLKGKVVDGQRELDIHLEEIHNTGEDEKLNKTPQKCWKNDRPFHGVGNIVIYSPPQAGALIQGLDNRFGTDSTYKPTGNEFSAKVKSCSEVVMTKLFGSEDDLAVHDASVNAGIQQRINDLNSSGYDAPLEAAQAPNNAFEAAQEAICEALEPVYSEMAAEILKLQKENEILKSDASNAEQMMARGFRDLYETEFMLNRFLSGLQAYKTRAKMVLALLRGNPEIVVNPYNYKRRMTTEDWKKAAQVVNRIEKKSAAAKTETNHLKLQQTTSTDSVQTQKSSSTTTSELQRPPMAQVAETNARERHETTAANQSGLSTDSKKAVETQVN